MDSVWGIYKDHPKLSVNTFNVKFIRDQKVKNVKLKKLFGGLMIHVLGQLSSTTQGHVVRTGRVWTDSGLFMIRMVPPDESLISR